jgi:hypothetical protein
LHAGRELARFFEGALHPVPHRLGQALTAHGKREMAVALGRLQTLRPVEVLKEIVPGRGQGVGVVDGLELAVDLGKDLLPRLHQGHRRFVQAAAFEPHLQVGALGQGNLALETHVHTLRGLADHVRQGTGDKGLLDVGDEAVGSGSRDAGLYFVQWVALGWSAQHRGAE